MRPFALLALALLCAAPLRAEPGRTSAAFLQRALGAQAAGMGSAFSAVPGRIDAIQYNPAAAATLTGPEATATYLSGFGGTTHGYIGCALPLSWGAWSAGLRYFNGGSFELNLSDGTTGRVTAEEDLAATVGFARRLFGGLYVGAAYRFVRMTLAEAVHATTHQGDLGVLLRLPGPLRFASLGGAYQYWGSDITFETVGDPPPKTFRYGLALRFPEVPPAIVDPSVDLKEFDLTFTADAVKPLYEDVSLRAGIELGLTPSYMNRVALRAGWVSGSDSESISLGVGLGFGRLLLDYSFGNADSLGALHQLSTTYRFGIPAER